MRLAPYPSYKPSGVEWLAEVPEHWDVDRLKWMAQGTINGVWGDEPNDVDDLACVRVADFDRERFRVHESPPTVRAIDPRQRDGRMLRRGDLLIEKSGGGDKQLVGCVVLFDHEYDAVCSNFVARMPMARGHHSRFWVYAHAALYAGRVNYPAIKQTTGIQNLDSSVYLDTLFAFPPEFEQRAIADFLDRETAKIDTLVARKRTLIERLKEKRTALISRTVTRGLPPDAANCAGLDPHPNLKPSGVDWLGDVPEQWEVAQLRRYTQFITSGSRGWAEYYADEGDIFVRMGNLTRDSIRVDVSDVQHVNPPVGAEGERTRVIEGDVLFSITAYLGSVGVANARIAGAYINQHIALVRLDQRSVLPRFAGYAMLAGPGQAQLAGQAYGGTKTQLALDDVKSVWVAIPRLEEQRAIADFLEDETAKIDAMTAKVVVALKRLQEYRTALITAAVTGKIDVRRATT